MIKEAYVSFETAKLLKNKYFDEEIPTVYTSCGTFKNIEHYNNIKNSDYNDITRNYFECTAPTLQLTMRWLREVHKIYIEIPLYRINPNEVLEDRKNRKTPYYSFSVLHTNTGEFLDKRTYNNCICDTYEEACEEAIGYCLIYLIK